jgi:signal transduction histidine kinase
MVYEDLFNIDFIKRQFNGCEECLQELQQDFVHSASKLVTEMQISWNSRDIEGLRKSAHTLKGGALTIGASRLASNLEMILGQIADGTECGLGNLLAETFEISKATVVALSGLVGSADSSVTDNIVKLPGKRLSDTVLIVEDEPVTAAHLRMIVEKLGYGITRNVDSGERAVAVAGVFYPDIVLMDINLAGKMNGIEAAKAIWIAHQIPSLFLSSSIDAETLRMARSSGMFGYILKPVFADQLDASIQMTLGRAEAERRLVDLNKNLELLVEDRTAELEASNQDMAVFCYAISHELRAPIARIEGFCNVLADDCNLTGDAANFAQRINSSGKQLKKVIDAILMLTRLGRQEMRRREQIDLSQMVRERFEKLILDHPDRSIELQMQPGVIVACDSGLLEMLLDNLLDNAIKFTANSESARIEFGRQLQDGRSFFFIRDNGVGFNASQAKNIFKPFVRFHTVKEFNGAGLGLAIAKKVVERHAGRIWAESAEGAGATFYFALP